MECDKKSKYPYSCPKCSCTDWFESEKDEYQWFMVQCQNCRVKILQKGSTYAKPLELPEPSFSDKYYDLVCNGRGGVDRVPKKNIKE